MWIPTFLIAVFLTASYRAVPLSFGDTALAGFLAVLIFASVTASNNRLNYSYLRHAWPLFAIMFFTLLVDIMLGRTGNYLLLIWAKFITVTLVGCALYALNFYEIKRALVLAIFLLIGQYIYFSYSPESLIAIGRRIGVEDPFVSYGSDLLRMYYAFFNANSAAYAIFFICLAHFCLWRVIDISRLEKISVVTALLILAFLTGGRAVMLLMAGFILAWFSSFRSTGSGISLFFLCFGWLLIYPFIELMDYVWNLRTASNLGRFSAMKRYFDETTENWVFGSGVQDIRERVEAGIMIPSHNFFLETIAYFGVFFGGIFLFILIHMIGIRPPQLSLKVVGLFALAVGLFNNTLLTHWCFFGLLVPVLLKVSTEVKMAPFREGSAPVSKGMRSESSALSSKDGN